MDATSAEETNPLKKLNDRMIALENAVVAIYAAMEVMDSNMRKLQNRQTAVSEMIESRDQH